METRDISLFIIQGAWVAIYSLLFTVIGSLPFGFYFLGPGMRRVSRTLIS
ncbi:TPA: DUF2534 family protein [Citrobacter farmeri]|uniref:DUF2534 domain-containing protein n=1 Tax=Citrobacter murliniae TaxID=67829 RepID=A0ABY2PZH3_9ENTR|nr:DUF2534 family protein [Escherichia coli]EJD6419228.1 DUF2534 family protein [Citrobacter freundii]MBN4809636.1 DUF2534 family protein [Citrobacter braakii]QEH54797.1 DUF2534 family protein [Citrobacter portucalensis]QLK39822.1 DUF2534 family protein [Citrobacter sp. 172116965]QMD51204.1 DUF2534 family protein [Citrobacter sp. RHB35-C21]THE42476.1 DUF2534 domain-containing protein [Citrobacter murliniae]HCB1654104.1 DUF2534 family protein [Citrobacter farmeri]